MPGREVNGMLPDRLDRRVVDVHRRDQVEPDASPVRVAIQIRAEGCVVFVVNQDDRASDLVERSLPSPIVANGLVKFLVTRVELRAGDFQPGIRLNLAFRTVVKLKERRRGRCGS